MKNVLLFLLIIFVACSPEKKPIDYGSDNCQFCKMTVVDRQHAAELVTTKGKVYYFDAIECMINYIDQSEQTRFAYLLVNDFEQPGELIDAETSHFLISKAIPSPMGAYLSAFENAAVAAKTKQTKGGELFDWKGIQQKITGKTISEK